MENVIKIQEAKNRLKMLQDEDALKKRTPTLWDQHKGEKIKGSKIGKNWYIRKEDLEAFLGG